MKEDHKEKEDRTSKPNVEGWIKLGLFLDNYLCIRLIRYKINPPDVEPKKKPSSFLLWFIAVYTATFGLASQKYENRVDALETRFNAAVSQLGTPARISAIGLLPGIQNTEIPFQPEFLDPLSIFKTIFGEKHIHDETVQNIIKVIETQKKDLKNADLQEAVLEEAYLKLANLQGADLYKADLRGAYLQKANLRGAYLYQTNLRGAYLYQADLRGAELNWAYLQEANLLDADLRGVVDIDGADLDGAKLGGATWTDGKICKEGSIGKCITD